MTRFFLLSFLILCLTHPANAQAADDGPREFEAIQSQLVHLNVYRQGYSWLIPWDKQDVQTRRGQALVLPNNQLLTTADLVSDSTLIEATRANEFRPFKANLVLLDLNLNLALLAVEQSEFFTGLKPIELAKAQMKEAAVYYYKDPTQGEVKSGVIEKLMVAMRKVTGGQVPVLLMNTSLEGHTEAAAVFQNQNVVGIVLKKKESTLFVAPSHLIESFLTNSRVTPYQSFGSRGFNWKRMPQDSTRAWLEVGLNDSGILVTEILNYGTGAQVLKRLDFLMEINGQAIGNDGKINHPDWGRVSFDYLFTSSLKLGSEIRYQLIRQGQQLQLTGKVSDYPPDKKFLPPKTVNSRPRYILQGGFLFQELNINYLENWGQDWANKAPVRLRLMADIDASLQENKDRHVVLLSRVIPDEINIGYQDLSNLVVQAINGHQVQNLNDLKQAFASNQGDFHLIDFAPGFERSQAVIPARQLEAANQRILKNYRIPQLQQLDSAN